MWLVAEARKEDLKLSLNATVRRIGSWWASTVVGRSTPSIPRRGRQANAALHRVVIVRMRWHQPTIDYVARRTAEGLSNRDIIRCLKRYLAREFLRLMPAPDAVAKPVDGELEIGLIHLMIYRSINALAETVVGLYKTECVKIDGPFRTVDELELATV